DGDGHLDLVVGCLRGPNRFFRNRGDGTFDDATEAIGLERRIYNTQAVALVDLNNDGILDMVFVNEGQPSVALLGDPVLPRTGIPVTISLTGKTGLTGARLRVLDGTARPVATWEFAGSAARGQMGPQACFALEPGKYRLEIGYSSGT